MTARGGIYGDHYGDGTPVEPGPQTRGENYIGVKVTLRRVTAKAVLVETDLNDPVWIARSCLHGADDRTVDKADIGSKITLRIFEWTATNKGLI